MYKKVIIIFKYKFLKIISNYLTYYDSYLPLLQHNTNKKNYCE